MPTTLDAFLMCRQCGRGTLHVFHERRTPSPAPGPEPSGSPKLDLIYVCEICETERVWGNERTLGREATRREALREHAIVAHGMRTVDCPACKGVGLDCAECGDQGEVWKWDCLDPCGPECPLGDDGDAG